eukprot:4543000-Prymnesium_polylepis.1
MEEERAGGVARAEGIDRRRQGVGAHEPARGRHEEAEGDQAQADGGRRRHRARGPACERAAAVEDAAGPAEAQRDVGGPRATTASAVEK